MRQVIITFGRSYKIFLAVAAIMIIQLISQGQFFLCGAVLIGALLCFFLVRLFGGAVGSGGKKKFCSSEKDYVDRSFVAAGNDFYSFGGCGAHIDGTFFGNVGMFCCFLCNCARNIDLSREEVKLWNISESAKP